MPSNEELAEAVYSLIQLIPPGYVTYYGSIARVLGIRPRRVAAILKRNKQPVVIPCHRVVMKDGSIGGYTPMGKMFKRRLLELEGVKFDGDKVSREHIIELDELIESNTLNQRKWVKLLGDRV